jgi:hypothetical protein
MLGIVNLLNLIFLGWYNEIVSDINCNRKFIIGF